MLTTIIIRLYIVLNMKLMYMYFYIITLLVLHTYYTMIGVKISIDNGGQ